MWEYLSFDTAYSAQLREWDTMFYRNVRADAVQVSGSSMLRPRTPSSEHGRS